MTEPSDPTHRDQPGGEETPLERAEEIYEEVAEENPDPATRREALEVELDEEGLSEYGGRIGEHND